MLPLTVPYKLIFIAAGVILAGVAGYTRGYTVASDKYTAREVATEAVYAQQIIKHAQEQAELKIKLGEDYEKAKLVIADLVARADTRVRLPRSKCAVSKSNTTEGSPIPDTATRDMDQRIEAVMEAGRRRVIGIVERAEIELASCAVVKAWVIQSHNGLH